MLGMTGQQKGQKWGIELAVQAADRGLHRGNVEQDVVVDLSLIHISEPTRPY